MHGFNLILVWTSVALLLVTVNRWTQLIDWADRNPSMSGWVQALGSILAIAVAIWLAHRQGNQQRLDRRLENADRLAELFAPPITLADEAIMELQALLQLRRTPPRTATGDRYRIAARIDERQRIRVTRILEEVKRLDPLKMPSASSILAVREVVNAVLDADWELGAMPHPSPRNMAEGLAATEFDKALQRIRAAVEILTAEKAKLSRIE